MEKYVREMSEKSKQITAPEGDKLQVIREIAAISDPQEIAERAYAFGRVVEQKDHELEIDFSVGGALYHLKNIEDILDRICWSNETLTEEADEHPHVNNAIVREHTRTIDLYLMHINQIAKELANEQKKFLEQQKNPSAPTEE